MKFKDNHKFGVEILDPIYWKDVVTSPITVTDHVSKGSRNAYRTDVRVKVRCNAFTKNSYRYLYMDKKGIYMRDDDLYVNGENIYKVYVDVPKPFRKMIKHKIKEYFKNAV